ncbi:hypothetical protein C8R43DRAFT_950098 [Mycena crocata]|nr:hypothetical protein C8R43DRAFT_950098 [Mycena crocata]
MQASLDRKSAIGAENAAGIDCGMLPGISNCQISWILRPILDSRIDQESVIIQNRRESVFLLRRRNYIRVGDSEFRFSWHPFPRPQNQHRIWQESGSESVAESALVEGFDFPYCNNSHQSGFATLNPNMMWPVPDRPAQVRVTRGSLRVEPWEYSWETRPAGSGTRVCG